jgi:CHASE3 domain sensor protein
VQILNMLQDAETGERGYPLTGEASYLEPYQAALPPLEAALPDLVARVVADGGQAELPRRSVGLAEAKIEEMRRTLGLAEEGQREAALALVRGGDARARGGGGTGASPALHLG